MHRTTECHPVAYLFPDMDEGEYEELKEDIKKNGVQMPVVTCQGKVADGRHRWRACNELGIKCPTVDFDGPEEFLLDFVVSLNMRRRHLNPSQRAMIAARIV